MRLLLLPLLAAFATTVLLGCDSTITKDENVNDAEDQGVRGTVMKYVGDFQCCSGDGEAFPLSGPVHIVHGAVAHDSSAPPPALDTLPLEVTVQSGADGRFEARLAPGRYTLFIEVDGELYLNCHEGYPEAEEYCSVVVEEFEFFEVDLADDSEAVS